MAEEEQESTPVENVKRMREKSVRYPAVDLKACVDFLSTVHSIGGRKEAPVESILSKLNLTSSETKSYKYLVSSAEIFGLVEKTSNGVKPTEVGTLLLYPPEGEDQKRKILTDVFKIPQLYQKIIERYDNMILPNNVILKNVFLHLGIAPKALDNAVEAFINSAQYANTIDSNNRLNTAGFETAAGSTPLTNGKINPKETDEKMKEDRLSSQTEFPKQTEDYHRFEFITSSGKKSITILPKEVTKRDIEKLKNFLDVFIPE